VEVLFGFNALVSGVSSLVNLLASQSVWGENSYIVTIPFSVLNRIWNFWYSSWQGCDFDVFEAEISASVDRLEEIDTNAATLLSTVESVQTSIATVLTNYEGISGNVNLLANIALTATYDLNGNEIGIVADMNSEIVSNYNVTVYLATQMGYSMTVHQQTLPITLTKWQSGKNAVEMNLLQLAANHANLYVLLQETAGAETGTVLPLPNLNPCTSSGCTLSFAQVASFDTPYFRSSFTHYSTVLVAIDLVNNIGTQNIDLNVVQSTADNAAISFLSNLPNGVSATQSLWNAANSTWEPVSNLFGLIFNPATPSPTVSLAYAGAFLTTFSALKNHGYYQITPVESSDSYMLYATVQIPLSQVTSSSQKLLTGGPSDCICFAVGSTTSAV